jgi:hypothetical protein
MSSYRAPGIRARLASACIVLAIAAWASPASASANDRPEAPAANVQSPSDSKTSELTVFLRRRPDLKGATLATIRREWGRDGSDPVIAWAHRLAFQGATHGGGGYRRGLVRELTEFLRGRPDLEGASSDTIRKAWGRDASDSTISKAHHAVYPEVDRTAEQRPQMVTQRPSPARPLMPKSPFANFLRGRPDLRNASSSAIREAWGQPVSRGTLSKARRAVFSQTGADPKGTTPSTRK